MAEEIPRVRTIVMKANIDCPGCREKMRRALLKIDGLYAFNIDAGKNKVTVNAKENTDPDKIISRLSRKTGKRLQLEKKTDLKPMEEARPQNLYPKNTFTLFSDEDTQSCNIM